MPLTPADVHNVAFKKPPIGKRGYDEEEVDAFLDEVERELARLIEENNELRAQVERGGGRGPAPAGPGADPRLASLRAFDGEAEAAPVGLAGGVVVDLLEADAFEPRRGSWAHVSLAVVAVDDHRSSLVEAARRFAVELLE